MFGVTIRNFYRQRVVFPLVAILISSCVYVPIEPVNERESESSTPVSTITVGLSTARPLGRHVSLLESPISEIRTIDFYVFSSTGEAVKHAFIDNQSSSQTPLTLQDGDYILYAIANMTNLSWFDREEDLAASLSLLSDQTASFPHMIGRSTFSVPLEGLLTTPVKRIPSLITITKLTNKLPSGKDIIIDGIYLKNIPGDIRLDLAENYTHTVWHNAAGYKSGTNIPQVSDFSHQETVSYGNDYSVSPAFISMPNDNLAQENGEPFSPRASAIVIKGSIEGEIAYWTGWLPELEGNFRYNVQGEIQNTGDQGDDDPPGGTINFDNITLQPWEEIDESGNMASQLRMYVYDPITLSAILNEEKTARIISSEGEIYILKPGSSGLAGISGEECEFIVVGESGDIYVMTSSQLRDWIGTQQNLEMQII